MREFSKREPIAPVGLSMVDKDAEILLHFLVDLFCLPIGLWVEGCGGVRGNVEHLIKFLHEFGDELRASIGFDYSGHSMACIDMISEDLAQPSAESSMLQVTGMIAFENQSMIMRIDRRS